MTEKNTSPGNDYLLPSNEQFFRYSVFSHKGLVRTNNEDRVGVQTFSTHELQSKHILAAVLADGVGGHTAGEIASKIGVETICEFIAGSTSLAEPERLLENAILKANQAILQQTEAKPEWKGMGSTCVCALIIENRLHVANLGDSRLYLYRKGKINQLTFDHTWLEEMVNLNMAEGLKITRNHPLAHVLSRYLGSSEPLQVDCRIRMKASQKGRNNQPENGLTLASGDRLLLSSDGISDLLNDTEIGDILSEATIEKAARTLVYHALKKGGHDNATAIVAEI